MAGLCVARFRLDVDAIVKRERRKREYKRRWFAWLGQQMTGGAPHDQN
jgi:hypothetical protein